MPSKPRGVAQPLIIPQPRQQLSADGLHKMLRAGFELIPDHRPRPEISLPDALLSAFALFSLKDPSLLAFDARRRAGNLQRLYRIGQVPSDTQMREILDPVDPLRLRPIFNDVFRALQRGKALEQFAFHDDGYLLALDGTGYFSSPTVHCESCLEKVNSQTGATTYAHQLLGAVIVHPERPEVIPLAPEAIIKQDGATKNDCERNAAKRLLHRIRQEHPYLKFIVIEDGLASNAPHIQELLNLDMHFILGAKPGDHAFLFKQWIAAEDAGLAVTLSEELPGGETWEISFAHGLSLNESHPDLRVNFLQYGEYDQAGEPRKLFTWVIDLEITVKTAPHLVRGGRARWKIENETFNTLKNQGYQFEHNFGHGRQNLSVVFAMLMMLAFLVDQTQQLCCPLFRATWKKLGSKRALWDNQRSHFRHIHLHSMQQMHELMLTGRGNELPAPGLDSS
jgi:hypothetical protein